MSRSRFPGRRSPPPPAPAPREPQARFAWWPLAGAVALVAAVFLVYWPALGGGFIFDDNAWVAGNALAKSTDGLYRIWFTTEPIDYWPVTNSAFWLEWRFFGARPIGYHATNVALHAINAILTWQVLRRLALPGAWIAAALFALHPTNVESVAWIAQQKNTLSMLWFLVSILLFLKAEDTNHQRWYWLSVAAFAVAFLSKASVVVLPAVLLVIVWWRRREIGLADLTRLIPFAAVAIPLTVVNFWFQNQRVTDPIRQIGAGERIAGAGVLVWFYLRKALLPIDLLFVYPRWEVGTSFTWWAPIATALLVTAALIRFRGHEAARSVLFGWVFYVIALLPVLGLVDVYYMRYSPAADHYEYIAILAVVALAAAVLARLPPASRIAGVAVLVCVLAVLSWQQARLYAGPEVLYRHTLVGNPGSSLVQNNLGTLLVDRAPEEAIAHFTVARDADPGWPEAYNNLCRTITRAGRPREAMADCHEGVRLAPGWMAAHSNLGLALLSIGDNRGAQVELETALRLRDDVPETHFNLAEALSAQGRTSDAAVQYRETLRLDPRSAAAHNGLGAMLEGTDPGAAEASYRSALSLEPRFSEARRNLADLMMATGRIGDAIKEYRQAVVDNPRSAEAHNNLGVALARQGRRDEAIEQMRQALEIDPNYAEVRANLEKMGR